MPTRPVILGNATALAPIGSAVESTYRIAQTISLSLQSSAGYTSFAWSVVGKPVGSSVTLGSLTGFTSTIAADVAGEYVIKGVATGADGTSSTRVSLIVVRSPGRGVRKAAAIRSQDVAQDVDHLKTLLNDLVDEHDLSAKVFNVKKYGAQGDGTTDDTAAIVAANAAAGAGGVVYFPRGSYNTTAQLTIGAGVTWLGEGKSVSLILHGFNGNHVIFGNESSAKNLGLVGQGATYTGRGVTVATGANRQAMSGCAITDYDGPCLEFLDTDAGTYSVFRDCRIARRNSVYGDAANPGNARFSIVFSPTAILSAVPRRFEDIKSDGTQTFDFGGTNDVFVSGSFLGGLKYTADTRGVSISNCRLANQLALAFAGFNNTISGCDIVSTITVSAGTGECALIGNSYNQTNPIVDNSALAGRNQFIGPTIGYAPTLTSGGTAPVLGNGTLTGQYARSGATVAVTIDLTVGTTTTLGTGDMRFSLPVAPGGANVLQHIGQGMVVTAANSRTFFVATATVGVAYASGVVAGAGGSITFNTPVVFAAGDVIRMTLTYSL